MQQSRKPFLGHEKISTQQSGMFRTQSKPMQASLRVLGENLSALCVETVLSESLPPPHLAFRVSLQ